MLCPPVATNDSRTIAEDGTLNSSVAALVNDVDSSSFTYAVVGDTPAGLVFDTATGSYSYTPAVNFNGAVSFQYTANDGLADSNIASVSINVTPVNDAPTAIVLGNSAVAENSATGTLVGLLSVLDVDGGTPAFSIVGAPVPFSINGDRLEVTGPLDFETQSVWNLTIRADDGAGGTFDQVFAISVTDVNEGGGNTPPVATNDSHTIAEDGSFNGSVAALVNDVDSSSFTYAVVGDTPAGLVFDTATGSYSYTPAVNFNGAVSFQYTANDGLADSNIASVSINVTPVNDAPTAIVLGNSAVAENSATGTLVGLLSVLDVDGGTPAFSIVGAPVPFSINGDRLEVTGPLDFETQSVWNLTIRADDGAGGTFDQVFAISVTDVNEGGDNTPPVATNDSHTIAEDGSFNGSVAALVNDVDSSSFTYAVVGDTPAGLVFDTATGGYTYTPAANFNGAVSFQYTANDGLADSNVATVSINVTPVNDAPTGNVSISDTTPLVNQVLSASNNLADVDGPLALAVSYQWQSSANNGVSWSSIAGASASTYTVNVPQGMLLRVRASYSDSNGTAEVVASAATSVVAGALLDGSSSADNLVGTSGNDEIQGLAGNDTLDGGLGSDTLRGGLGDDLYVVDNTSDVIEENLNEGTDTVNSTVGYTLPTNVEVLELFGDQPISGTGNALGNHISGWRNPAANVLTGGTGSDWYYVGAGDTIVELSNQGTDTASITVDYTLPNNVENLVFNALVGTPSRGTGNTLNNSLTGGAGNDRLEGLGGNDTLTGGAGNDTLDGGGGNDSMAGGAGNDTYIVGSTGDVITENASQGTDLVESSVTWTLGADLENLTLTGSSTINGIGNALDNTLTGNSAANSLSGLDGNDLVIGGGGNDTLSGGNGSDTLRGGAGVDSLTGGAGNDLFDFDAISESRVGVGLRDIITDFVRGQDQIDLSTIDANSGASGNQSFSFIGTANFTGAAQVRYFTSGGTTNLQGNVGGTNGNTVDFEIQLTGTYTLQSTDLIP